MRCYAPCRSDIVQYEMERMAPEFADLREKKLFSEAELKLIIEKRRRYEYRIASRAASADDFLEYIGHEMTFEDVRRLRKRAIHLETAHGASEFAVVRRVHGLYNRLLRRHGREWPLWMQYVDFALRVKSVRALQRILAQCASLHGNKRSEVWLLGALLLRNVVSNTHAARVFLQRGLRMHPLHPHLLVETFRFELFVAIEAVEEARIAMGTVGARAEELALAQDEREVLVRERLEKMERRQAHTKAMLAALLPRRAGGHHKFVELPEDVDSDDSDNDLMDDDDDGLQIGPKKGDEAGEAGKSTLAKFAASLEGNFADLFAGFATDDDDIVEDADAAGDVANDDSDDTSDDDDGSVGAEAGDASGRVAGFNGSDAKWRANSKTRPLASTLKRAVGKANAQLAAMVGIPERAAATLLAPVHVMCHMIAACSVQEKANGEDNGKRRVFHAMAFQRVAGLLLRCLLGVLCRRRRVKQSDGLVTLTSVMRTYPREVMPCIAFIEYFCRSVALGKVPIASDEKRGTIASSLATFRVVAAVAHTHANALLKDKDTKMVTGEGSDASTTREEGTPLQAVDTIVSHIVAACGREAREKVKEHATVDDSMAAVPVADASFESRVMTDALIGALPSLVLVDDAADAKGAKQEIPYDMAPLSVLRLCAPDLVQTVRADETRACLLGLAPALHDLASVVRPAPALAALSGPLSSPCGYVSWAAALLLETTAHPVRAAFVAIAGVYRYIADNVSKDGVAVCGVSLERKKVPIALWTLLAVAVVRTHAVLLRADDVTLDSNLVVQASVLIADVDIDNKARRSRRKTVPTIHEEENYVTIPMRRVDAVLQGHIRAMVASWKAFEKAIGGRKRRFLTHGGMHSNGTTDGNVLRAFYASLEQCLTPLDMGVVCSLCCRDTAMWPIASPPANQSSSSKNGLTWFTWRIVESMQAVVTGSVVATGTDVPWASNDPARVSAPPASTLAADGLAAGVHVPVFDIVRANELAEVGLASTATYLFGSATANEGLDGAERVLRLLMTRLGTRLPMATVAEGVDLLVLHTQFAQRCGDATSGARSDDALWQKVSKILDPFMRNRDVYDQCGAWQLLMTTASRVHRTDAIARSRVVTELHRRAVSTLTDSAPLQTWFHEHKYALLGTSS